MLTAVMWEDFVWYLGIVVVLIFPWISGFPQQARMQLQLDSKCLHLFLPIAPDQLPRLSRTVAKLPRATTVQSPPALAEEPVLLYESSINAGLSIPYQRDPPTG